MENKFLLGTVLFLATLLSAVIVFENVEKNVFNKEFETKYSLVEWLCAEDTIKEFALGKKARMEIDIK